MNVSQSLNDYPLTPLQALSAASQSPTQNVFLSLDNDTPIQPSQKPRESIHCVDSPRIQPKLWLLDDSSDKSPRLTSLQALPAASQSRTHNAILSSDTSIPPSENPRESIDCVEDPRIQAQLGLLVDSSDEFPRLIPLQALPAASQTPTHNIILSLDGDTPIPPSQKPRELIV